MATSASLDPDLDALISRLAGPLLPADRAAFRVAAESALIGCGGEGLAYRILRDVWRGYFHPPPDPRLGQPRGAVGLRRPGSARGRSRSPPAAGGLSMYWCAARLQGHREGLALHCLELAGYETYYPRLRDRRIRHGRRIELRPALFPGYAFVLIQLQWHAARWTAGVINLIMDGVVPARVPDDVIAEIRGREVDGLINLAPSPPLRRGARVRILRGPFTGHLAIFADMRPRQRVEILLQLLGGEQRVTLAKKDIEVVR